MTPKPRVTLAAIRVPLSRPLFGDGDRIGGVHYGGATTRRDAIAALTPPTAEELEDPAVAAGLAEIDRLDAEVPLVVWADGVRFADPATGLTIDVVPGEAAPIHWSETAVTGDGPDVAPSISRRFFNALARDFLQRGAAIDWMRERPRWPSIDDDDGPGARPNDERLARFVANAYAAGESPRQELARFYAVSPNSADEWIKRARRVAPEYGINIPAPTRGRGHKRGDGQ